MINNATPTGNLYLKIEWDEKVGKIDPWMLKSNFKIDYLNSSKRILNETRKLG
jgi:hypothetical protein